MNRLLTGQVVRVSNGYNAVLFGIGRVVEAAYKDGQLHYLSVSDVNDNLAEVIKDQASAENAQITIEKSQAVKTLFARAEWNTHELRSELGIGYAQGEKS